MSKNFLISVDDELIEIYLNGKNVSVSLNFPFASVWTVADTYNLTEEVYVIAVMSHNNNGIGGLRAKFSDDYILTNDTWKCTNKFYVGWYKLNYNDSFWDGGMVGQKQSANPGYPPNMGKSQWIIDSTDCSCRVNFYCRKVSVDHANRYRYRNSNKSTNIKPRPFNSKDERKISRIYDVSSILDNNIGANNVMTDQAAADDKAELVCGTVDEISIIG
ncbi:hypothetical protein HELRODRAFT_180243 [Helobdella robusta]|uniref:Uncharacterized protein n=1 Tax=Helobdella robusta TaxID=6412 RepID=T1FFM1_HELRO|nr:hypothetical protein HELRODRAFT_180243 [Helobdella robusta]ESN94075.1 hypothetical protein HELRODRAFT_180243 [Helobdella robusta]